MRAAAYLVFHLAGTTYLDISPGRAAAYLVFYPGGYCLLRHFTRAGRCLLGFFIRATRCLPDPSSGYTLREYYRNMSGYLQTDLSCAEGQDRRTDPDALEAAESFRTFLSADMCGPLPSGSFIRAGRCLPGLSSGQPAAFRCNNLISYYIKQYREHLRTPRPRDGQRTPGAEDGRTDPERGKP